MLFNSNDYPLDKEYRTRMMKQAHQDHLAEEARTTSTDWTVIGKKRVTFAVVTVTLTTLVVVGLQYVLT